MSGNVKLVPRNGKALSRQYAYQMRHRDAGLCRKCPEPVEEGYLTHCAKHRVGRGRRPRWDDDRTQAFIAAWNQGFADWELASQLDMTVQAVHSAARRLRERGLPLLDRKRKEVPT